MIHVSMDGWMEVVTKESEKDVENALPTLNLKRKQEPMQESAKERKLESKNPMIHS
jgi:hypothetical protein